MLNQSSEFKFDSSSIYFSDPTNQSSMWINQYMPEKSQSYSNQIIQHIGYIDNRITKFTPRQEKQRIIMDIYNQSSNSIVDLPIVRYKNTQVLVDGVQYSVTSSKRETIQLLIKKRGSHKIEIYYNTPILFILSAIVGLFTGSLSNNVGKEKL